MRPPPILDNKAPEALSVFDPKALLREARRQKGLGRAEPVPDVCVLDRMAISCVGSNATGKRNARRAGLATTQICTPSPWPAGLLGSSAAQWVLRLLSSSPKSCSRAAANS